MGRISKAKFASSERFTESEIASFAESAKLWRSKFLEVYQSKNVTPYMHAFVSHAMPCHAMFLNFCKFMVLLYPLRNRG